jgi:cysteine desulfurase family protein (TIGR01976 family)
MALNLEWIRDRFPALHQEIKGQPIIFLDGPGGTQVPRSVIEAIGNYLLESNANAHGAFPTSVRTDATIGAARRASADFLGCDPDEIVFGANMTTLTFALSRAIGRDLQPEDEIVVTKLDHEANVSPWCALKERGAIIRFVDIDTKDCTLDMAALEQLINERTKIVAIGYASNAVGTINDVATAVKLARAVGALVFVDAVHYAPHRVIDVSAIDCDFLACSAYKFFGPHVGFIYGKREHLTRLQPYKVRPASAEIPSHWETGTQNHEALAGLIATIDYLAELGKLVSPSASDRRAALIAAMQAIEQYETELCQKAIDQLLQIPSLSLYGITDPKQSSWRTPTMAIRLAEITPHQVAKALGDRGIFTWNGNFYASYLTEGLGVESSGGFVRIGLVHYNTSAEIDRLLTALEEIRVQSR